MVSDSVGLRPAADKDAIWFEGTRKGPAYKYAKNGTSADFNLNDS